jgi:hypothetical protein
MYANDFFEISQALSSDDNLKNRVVKLIQERPIPGKVLEGNGRDLIFRGILMKIVNGEVELSNAIQDVELLLSEQTSPHSGNKRVFPANWGERLIRIQLSRFYNQGVLTELKEKGIQVCLVPHSRNEDPSSACSSQLAGRQHSVDSLLKSLLLSYEDGVWDKTPKIPDHPHCTHVVKPLD